MASVTVMLPHALLANGDHQGVITVQAGTIRNMIDALEAAHPGLRFHLCYESGELRPFVNVFLAGVNVRYLQGLETALGPGDQVAIFPSVAGG